jgi:hypothetical protein
MDVSSNAGICVMILLHKQNKSRTPLCLLFLWRNIWRIQKCTQNFHSELSYNTRIENFEDFNFLYIKINNVVMIRRNLFDI